jgi:hypothetical protein
MNTMKMINNAGLKSRIRQVLVLIAVILIGIIISNLVDAKVYNGAASFFK